MVLYDYCFLFHCNWCTMRIEWNTDNSKSMEKINGKKRKKPVIYGGKIRLRKKLANPGHSIFLCLAIMKTKTQPGFASFFRFFFFEIFPLHRKKRKKIKNIYKSQFLEKLQSKIFTFLATLNTSLWWLVFFRFLLVKAGFFHCPE